MKRQGYSVQDKIQDLHWQGSIICYLDEKWFYLFSRIKKPKYLPRVSFEEKVIYRVRVIGFNSQTHPVKAVFMGIILTGFTWNTMWRGNLHIQLEEDVSDLLCFQHVTQVSGARTNKRICHDILGHETLENKFFISEEGNQLQLTIQDVQLSCFLPAWTVIEKEVNCNSAFKLQVLLEIALEICQKIHWTNLLGDG